MVSKLTLSGSLVSKIVAKRYKTQRVLGRGGMGTVYLAEDGQLEGELVALKILHKELCREESQVTRFLREIKMTRHVTHQNIVRTFDVGVHGDRLFFTMEYVEGSTLSEMCQQDPLPAEQVINILKEITLGLDAIHEAGIIHRDLKSSNIIITQAGRVKIADFGVARPDFSDLTGHHEIVGSIHSIAPEIWSGEDESPASDIYSLGILAYEIITGVKPFDGSSPHEMMCKHLQVEPLPPIEIVDGIPRWLNDMILKMLSKERHERFQSAREVRERIEAALKSSSESSDFNGVEEDFIIDDFDDLNEYEQEYQLDHEICPSGRTVVPYGLPQDSEGVMFDSKLQEDISNSLGSEKKYSKLGAIALINFCKHILPTLVLAYILLVPFGHLADQTWQGTFPSSSLGLILSTIGFQLALFAFLFSLPVLPVSSVFLGVKEGLMTWAQTARNLGILFGTIFIINGVRLEYAAGEAFEKYAFNKGQLLESLRATAANITEAAMLLPMGTAFEARVNYEEAVFVQTEVTSLAPHLSYYFILFAFFVLIIGTMTKEVFLFRSRLASAIAYTFFIAAVVPGTLLFSLKHFLPELMPQFLFQSQRVVLGPFTYNMPYSNLVVACINWFAIMAVTGVLIYLNSRDQVKTSNNLKASESIKGGDIRKSGDIDASTY